MTLLTGNKRTSASEPCHRRAFTLIELILVMAMLLIVIAVAAPTLSKFFRGRNLDSEARRFVSLTRYGQSRAVSEGVPMVLWIDAKLGRYGLQQEVSYTGVDLKAVEYALDKELRVQVTAAVAQPGQLMQARPTARNLPMLRFRPDGFISETSPERITIYEGERDSTLIAPSRNRLHYEIVTNQSQILRR
ncbi:MAG: prepilin-type N-terminal cleavage/methylation domain-containing protein [Verrucomicrobia bacterium]|nr:prepilin-type N-terminal cleavage/methylation domain-containing protein [Verrucomicrobiota bacterium]